MLPLCRVHGFCPDGISTPASCRPSSSLHHHSLLIRQESHNSLCTDGFCYDTQWNYETSKHYIVRPNYTHNCLMALQILSGTTWVSRNQKKHSPTHTYRGHQSSLICLMHLLQSMASSLFTIHNLSPSFLWCTSWPGTLHFILHRFLHPIIAFFSQNMPIPLQPVLL